MSELIARSAIFTSVNKEARTVDFVASTAAIDSYEEIVEQDWILDRFRSNPVILFGHNSRELPVGKASRVEVVGLGTDKHLEVTVQFASKEANPLAENVWQSVIEGTLRAVSVGFMPGDYRFEKRDNREVLVFSKCELHEVSVVPIPANHEALAKMRAKAAAAKDVRSDAPKQETKMNLEEATKRIADLEAEKRAGEKETTALKAQASTIEKEHAKAVADRDAATARAEKAEASLIELQVHALVGVKITPAEKDDFVELAKSSPALFAKMVKARPEMKLLGGAVMPEAKDGQAPPPPTSTNGAGESLAKKIFGA